MEEFWEYQKIYNDSLKIMIYLILYFHNLFNYGISFFIFIKSSNVCFIYSISLFLIWICSEVEMLYVSFFLWLFFIYYYCIVIMLLINLFKNLYELLDVLISIF